MLTHVHCIMTMQGLAKLPLLLLPCALSTTRYHIIRTTLKLPAQVHASHHAQLSYSKGLVPLVYTEVTELMTVKAIVCDRAVPPNMCWSVTQPDQLYTN